MTALEETQIRIKVYNELIESLKEVFSGHQSGQLDGVHLLLEGLVKNENELIEKFELKEA